MQTEKITLLTGHRWKRILAVLLLVVYQMVGQIYLTTQIVKHAEEVSITRLAEATKAFSQNYYEHVMDDREQLSVVADMLAVLMAEEHHDLSVHLASFEQRGMLDWLQVLLPDGTLITGSGRYDLTSQLSYQTEVERLPFISNVSSGYIDPGRRVIRSAVPIRQNEEIIAILYGVYDLSMGTKVKGTNVFQDQSFSFILESDSGQYIHNGLSGTNAVGEAGSEYAAKPGYDMSVLIDDLAACREGYSAFHAKSHDGYMYIYYTPVGINNWMAMVSVPEKVALVYSIEFSRLMLGSMLYICLGVFVYFVVLYISDHKLQNKNKFISLIQARLMEIHHKPEYYRESLRAVADRAKSNAAFLIDTAHPVAETIEGWDQAAVDAYLKQPELAEEILSLACQHRQNLMVRADSPLLQQYPKLVRFLNAHGLHTFALCPISSADGTIHQAIGALNPTNPNTLLLLNTVANSFLMAANNMDYLNRLEIASTIDGLTRVMNRTSYQLRLENLNGRIVSGLGCVYIDVNDLHAINNRYGHEHGDIMLRTIAAALSKAFGQKNVYRFGGDEFVILAENITQEWLDAAILTANTAIEAAGYTVSTGADWAASTQEVLAMIREAEARMYKAKYQFYQERQQKTVSLSSELQAMHSLQTEDMDVNDFLLAAQHRYRGAYVVNLATDEVRVLFSRHYFVHALENSDKSFSAAFRMYLTDIVAKQSRRSIQNFFDLKQINDQLMQFGSPTVEYTKADGERLRITVYRSSRYTPENPESLWVFELL